MEPLLFCSDLRVDRLGQPEIDGLTLTADASSLAVLSAPRALLLATAGQAVPARGQIRILGSRPRSLLERGELATVFFTDPLESGRTVLDHLHASAELAGASSSRRDGLVNDALARTKLESHRRMKLAKASGLVRRGAHLAAALATGASTLVLSDPVEELEPEAAHTFLAALTEATAGKARITFHGQPGRLAADLAPNDLALVFFGSTLAAQGTARELIAQTRTYAVHLAGDVTAFSKELTERAWDPISLGPGYLRITLPKAKAPTSRSSSRNGTASKLPSFIRLDWVSRSDPSQR